MLGLSKEEYKKLKKDQFTEDELDQRATIAVRVCPPFVDQVDNYFVVIPANLHEEIKRISGKRRNSKVVERFLNWLFVEAEQQRRHGRGWVIRIGIEKLAIKMRMDSYLKKRDWKRIRGILKECYEIAEGLGYLLDYKTVRGVIKDQLEEFTLNPNKFYIPDKYSDSEDDNDENQDI